MKVLAFNCSPKMERSNTTLLPTPFLEGMEEAGAEVELLYIRTLKINTCTGEFDYWFKHPGRCYQDDDMNAPYPKMRQADLWVIGTPLHSLEVQAQ
jgi:multimeric flavodoxin WrbA